MNAVQRYAKALAAVVGFAAEALNAGLVHGAAAHTAAVVIAAVTAALVYVVKNAPPSELDQLPGQVSGLFAAHQSMGQRLVEVEAIAKGLPTIAEYITKGIVDGLAAVKTPDPAPAASEPAAPEPEGQGSLSKATAPADAPPAAPVEQPAPSVIDQQPVSLPAAPADPAPTVEQPATPPGPGIPESSVAPAA